MTEAERYAGRVPRGNEERVASPVDAGIRARRRVVWHVLPDFPPRPTDVLALALSGLLLLLCASPLSAQSARGVRGTAPAIVPVLSLQVRVGATVPAGGFRDPVTDWDGDGGEAVSFGAMLTLSRGRIVNPYLGIGEHRVSCDATTCGGERDLTLSGFDLGTRIFPLGRGSWAPWLRVGAVRYAIESSGPGTAEEETASGSWGVEAGAGLEIHVTGDLLVSPGARWIRMDGDLPSGDLRFRSFVVDLGVVLGF